MFNESYLFFPGVLSSLSPPLLRSTGYVTAQFRKHGEGVAGFLKEASRSDKHGKNLAAICEGILFVMIFVYAC